MLGERVVRGRRHGVVFFGAIGHVEDVCVTHVESGMSIGVVMK